MVWIMLLACRPDAVTCGEGTVLDGTTCVPVATDTEPTDSDTGTAPEPEPLLRDDFDDIDLEVWEHGDWALGITQLDPAQVSAGDGVMSIEVRKDGSQWLGGELLSQETFGHSEWSARIAGPEDTGTVCAFFMYGAVVLEDTWVSNELDFEILDGRVMMTSFSQWRLEDGWPGDGPTHETTTWEAPEGFLVSDWHTYTFRYAPDAVSFFVDGELATTLEAAVPLGEMHVRFNHWTTDTWPAVGGPPDSDQRCRVDWIEGSPL